MDKKFCVHCGKEIDKDSVYCCYCGTHLQEVALSKRHSILLNIFSKLKSLFNKLFNKVVLIIIIIILISILDELDIISSKLDYIETIYNFGINNYHY